MSKKQGKIIIIALVGIFFCQYSFSQALKYSNAFLEIGVGGRAKGMGEAVIASGADAFSGYWNPAGILSINSNTEFAYMHSEYFARIAKHDFMSGIYKPDENTAFGLSIIRFGIDDIPNTLDLIDENNQIDYSRVTTFSAADYAFLLSFARTTKVEGLDVGGNVKIIRRIIGKFANAWGFGLDGGITYTKGTWKFATVAKDVTSTFNAWSINRNLLEDAFLQTGNEIPENSIEVTLPSLVLGSAKEWKFKNDKIGLLTELNARVMFDGRRQTLLTTDFASIDPGFGAEVNYLNLFYLRGGLYGLQNIQEQPGKKTFLFQPTIGLGIKYKFINLDYAFTDIGDNSLAFYSHVFSVQLRIPKK